MRASTNQRRERWDREEGLRASSEMCMQRRPRRPMQQLFFMRPTMRPAELQETEEEELEEGGRWQGAEGGHRSAAVQLG